MTGLERYNDRPDTLASTDAMETAWRLAQRIHNTEFVPKGLRGSPEKVLAALLLGREKGIGAMTALSHIDVIEGKAVSNAELKQALAESAGARFKTRESSNTRCVLHAWAPGDTGEPTVVTWTIEDAKNAGLSGKDNWRKYPKRMLFRRAMSDATSMVAAAAIVGLPPAYEEIDDDAYQTAVVDAPDNVQRRTVTRRQNGQIAPAPPVAERDMPTFDDDVIDIAPTKWAKPETSMLDDNDEPAALPLEDGEIATSKQVAKLSILFNRKGWDDDQIDAYILELSASRTASRKELTKTEASKAIDELEMVAS